MSWTPKRYKPFTLYMEYPVGDRKTIRHKARMCEAVVRDPDGKVLRGPNGQAIKQQVRVKRYTQRIPALPKRRRAR